jgi:hypothetical protein
MYTREDESGWQEHNNPTTSVKHTAIKELLWFML